MLPLSICNFFKFFIYHPKSEYLSKKDQKIAMPARKILNVLSLTLIPKLCKGYWSKRNVWSHKEKTTLCHRIRTAIQSTTILPLNQVEGMQKREGAKKIPCHNILHGLYLGNAKAFIEATHLRLPLDEGGSVSMQNTNHEQFNSVLTYCPMDIICDDYPTLDVNAVAPSFANHRVKWLNFGKTAIDSRNGWPGLIHDSTLPQSDLAKTDLNFKKLDEENKINVNGPETLRLNKLLDDKKTALGEVNITKWFEPVFDEIDRAVFHNKRVLVHCQKGYSRSSTILAAYLINRFDVSTDEALTFLKSKRFCVDSKFTAELRSYHQSLAEGR
jgi:hypothetical protein